jgi:predicted dithiol-disulfide oxidoreductase (DUF899 family)
MPRHTVGTREEWLAARLDLLEAEKELTRRGDELAKQRQQLPWVPVEKEYRFDDEDGQLSLRDLFGDQAQLLVYNFMFGPDWTEGCPSCSSVADGFDGIRVHLEHHDAALAAVSRAPIEKLTAYKQRMGWSFPWVSSFRSDFNFDFGVSFTEESVALGAEYNFRRLEAAQLDPRMLPFEGHWLSAFALDGDAVYHTYSAYARGTDALWAMWQWLDRAPLGRNEGDMPRISLRCTKSEAADGRYYQQRLLFPLMPFAMRRWAASETHE